MASLIYDSAVNDIATGLIDLDTDTFWVMLTTSTYTANKQTHAKRSDVTNEVSGTGYSAGGQVVTATVTPDTANDRVNVTFSTVTWPTSTITARYCVVYKRRGGLSSADNLLFLGDFGSNISTTGGTFTLTFTGPLRFQN
jgi:hypothetical protein